MNFELSCKGSGGLHNGVFFFFLFARRSHKHKEKKCDCDAGGAVREPREKVGGLGAGFFGGGA